MSDQAPIIKVENLGKVYGLQPVLQGLDFQIMRGESVALLGQNGSGKSTLLRLLAGLSKPTAGAIRIGGWAIPNEAMAARGQIGMVAHHPLLYDNLSARENLDFFAKLYGMAAAERESRTGALLDQVGLRRRAEGLVRDFSRGMQQRLSIARALLHEPDVLLFDEPYTGLDQEAAELLDALLGSARQQGRTVLVSTHQLDRAPILAPRAIILSRGQIAFDGNTEGMTSAELGALVNQGGAVA